MKSPHALILLIVGAVLASCVSDGPSPSNSLAADLRRQIADLQEQRTLPSAKTRADALDREIAVLQKRLEELEAEERMMEDMRQEQKAKENARREAERAEENARRDAERAQQRCAELKVKKISDLTVGDAEALKACGISIPGLRVQ